MNEIRFAGPEVWAKFANNADRVDSVGGQNARPGQTTAMTTADPQLSELISGTTHSFPNVRLRSIKGLAKMGFHARQALPALRAAVHDSDPKVREAAAQAIGQMGPDALTALIGMLTHTDKYVRRNAVWGLGRLGTQATAAIPDLCTALKDSDARTASGAAQALGSIGPAAVPAVPALAEAMRGTNIVLCRLAAKGLSMIGQPALSTLIQHLKHHDPFVRGEAAVALGWMGSGAAAAVPALIELLRTTARVNRSYAVADNKTPPTGVSVGGSDQPPDAGVRVNVVVALGRIGPDAVTSLSYLQDALHDEAEAVGRAAAVAIRQVQSR